MKVMSSEYHQWYLKWDTSQGYAGEIWSTGVCYLVSLKNMYKICKLQVIPFLRNLDFIVFLINWDICKYLEPIPKCRTMGWTREAAIP